MTPDRRVAAVLASPHLAAIAAVVAAGLPLPVIAGAIAVTCGQLAVIIRRHYLLRGRYAVRRLGFDRTHGWTLVDGNGERCQVVPERAGSIVLPGFAIVRMRGPGRTGRTVVLGPPGCRDAARRRLRVLLRLAPAAPGTNPDGIPGGFSR